LNAGFFDFLLEVLLYEETYELLSTGLDCLRNFFEGLFYIKDEFSKGKNILVNKFLEKNGACLLEKLQLSKNDLISAKSVAIVEDFFENKFN